MACADRNLYELVEALHAAALGERSWHDLAPMFAQAFDAPSCSIQVQNRTAGGVTRLSQTANYTPKFTREYVEYYHRHDPYIGAVSGLPNVAVCTNDFISDRELMRTEFYDWCRTAGAFYVLGSVLQLGKNCGKGVIGIHRSRTEGSFANHQKERLQIILPQLRRALLVHAQFAANEIRRRIANDALESLALGVLLLREDRTIIFANSSAERLLQNGSAIFSSTGRLAIRDRRRAAVFGKMLREANMVVAQAGGRAEASGLADNSSSGSLALPMPDGGALSLLVCPVPPAIRNAFTPPASAVVFITDSRNDPRLPVDFLAQTYGLSPAEARLAAALAKGERIEEFCDRCRITRNTAKTQLSAVFRKTATARQNELVRLVSSNPLFKIAGGWSRCGDVV